MDKYKIDSHKLMYHVSRVNKWLEGEDVYPIYVEIGLYGGCNHNCVFCAFDYLDQKPDIIDEKSAAALVLQLSKKGIKSVLYSGEGEPLLHKNAKDIIAFTKENGIDAALSTNGVFLDKGISRVILPHLTWLRVSLNAGTKEGYSGIHGTAPEDFEKVLTNLKDAVRLKKSNNYYCAIGVQFLLMPDNVKELVPLAGVLKDIGIDYLVVKPYAQHPQSKNKIKDVVSSKELAYLENYLEKEADGGFNIIFRYRSIANIEDKKPYKKCFGLSFITHIAASGDVYPCNAFVGKKEYSYGNIYKNSFEKIWNGDNRKNVFCKIEKEFDLNNCRKACRMDEINRYLWELKNPGEHNNFI